jgi:predicted phage tail component-like protein
MQIVTYRSRSGAEITFKRADPYVLWTVDGVGNPEIELQRSRAIGQDASTVQNYRTEVREISLRVHIHAETGELYPLRRNLYAVLSPGGAPGELLYENDAGRYWLPAYPAQPSLDEKVRFYQTMTLRFLCPDPFWRATVPGEGRLFFGDGAFRFPLGFPVTFGRSEATGTLYNRGDVPAYAEFWVTGGAKNPTIRNLSTGEGFSVARTFDRDKTLYIRTEQGAKQVQMLGKSGVLEENAFGYLTPDSTLFALRTGENKLSFRSENEEMSASVRVKFVERYTGV